jgi:hypothetical protein
MLQEIDLLEREIEKLNIELRIKNETIKFLKKRNNELLQDLSDKSANRSIAIFVLLFIAAIILNYIV